MIDAGSRMDIYDFFAKHNIEYERHDHPPVYTVAQANQLVPSLPAAKTKNLFLKDRKGRQHFLVVLPGDKRVDLGALSTALNVKKLGFASEQHLKQYLGIEPGAVSILAVFNDKAGEVELIVDQDLWQAKAFQCHPLVNTSTLVIKRPDLQRFLQLTQHLPHLIEVPTAD